MVPGGTMFLRAAGIRAPLCTCSQEDNEHWWSEASTWSDRSISKLKLHKEGEKLHREQNYMVEAKSEGKGRQSYRGRGAHAIQAKRRMAEEVASSSSLKLLLLNLHTFCSLTTSCFGSFPFTSLSCLFLFKDSCLLNLVSSTLDTIFIPTSPPSGNRSLSKHGKQVFMVPFI